jgi:hypothetical protein
MAANSLELECEFWMLVYGEQNEDKGQCRRRNDRLIWGDSLPRFFGCWQMEVREG